ADRGDVLCSLLGRGLGARGRGEPQGSSSGCDCFQFHASELSVDRDKDGDALAAARRRQLRHETMALIQKPAYNRLVRCRPRLKYSGTAIEFTSSQKAQFSTRRCIIRIWPMMLNTSTVESRKGE